MLCITRQWYICGQGTTDYILEVIRLRIWIQEFLGFFKVRDRAFSYNSGESDKIFMKIISQVYPYTRKSPLNFGIQSRYRDTDSRFRPHSPWQTHAVCDCSCYYYYKKCILWNVYLSNAVQQPTAQSDKLGRSMCQPTVGQQGIGSLLPTTHSTSIDPIIITVTVFEIFDV